MPGPRQRTLIIACVTFALAWLIAGSGYMVAKKSKMTAERVAEYARSIDFEKLAGADRAKALRKLDDMWNAVPPADRHGSYLREDWFTRLTDEEKAQFVEATMPAEMKQALAEFERFPPEKRQSDIDEAMKHLQENRGTGTNAPMSAELSAKIRTIGLNTLYNKSSARTKAELAPLLIEVQRQLEAGRLGNVNGW